MRDEAERFNEAIRDESEALYRLLSDLGRRAAFPPDIPFQAGEARGKRFNATIGQITSGDGRILALPAIEGGLDLDEEARNRALLYSPIQGIERLRQRWGAWQRRGGEDGPATLPLVTVGLTHGLSLVADLFAGPRRPVAVATPFWGNYRQAFALRTGAEMVTAPAYVGGRFHPQAISSALTGVRPGEPAIAILNVPSNPGGYSPTPGERDELVDSLLRVADSRPLLVVCDDAYAGLVYEEGISARSLFWELGGRHPNLVPVKVDGATKEFDLFGGRVGFLTFPFAETSPSAAALESKVKCLTRATVGSPVAVSQVLLLAAMDDEDVEAEIERVHATLERRYRALKKALEGIDRDLLRPLPFNSGCFALVELAESVDADAETVRHHLLDHHETGLIAIGQRFLRIAFCSVEEEALPELVQRLERGVRELAG